MKERIYLDNSATTRVDEKVLEAMLPCFRENFGNASSVHIFGQEARAVVEDARRSVAELLGADTREIGLNPIMRPFGASFAAGIVRAAMSSRRRSSTRRFWLPAKRSKARVLKLLMFPSMLPGEWIRGRLKRPCARARSSFP
jgi:hypothetical protein